jgi:hypothetical protein
MEQSSRYLNICTAYRKIAQEKTAFPLRWLRLFRRATLDLILTKMMRGEDPQDMEDVAFLIRHDQITPAEMEEAFIRAVIPDLVELRDAFERAKPIVRKLVRELGSGT